MIFNINSTRGQTRFLTCVARVTCLVAIIRSKFPKVRQCLKWLVFVGAYKFTLCANSGKSWGIPPLRVLETSLDWHMSLFDLIIRGRSQLSTFMKAYTAYARGSGTTVRFSPENQHLFLTLSYSPIWNQNVPQEIPFFIQNQYSVIARKKSKTPAIISRVKI